MHKIYGPKEAVARKIDVKHIFILGKSHLPPGTRRQMAENMAGMGG